jgi:4'-phosphopantetheinyl transferase
MPGTSDPPLAHSPVDVYLLHPAACAPDDQPGLLAWLHPTELERYHRFVFDRHRLEYLATRALVRRALCAYRPIAPAAWQFRTTAHGRPEIDPPCGLTFNLANHPTLVVCAIRPAPELAVEAPARGPDLGVDVEPLTRGAEILAIADSVFAPDELAALRALPEPTQPDRAVALWTLKEAYIKARGLGLSLPLDGFAFAFDHAHPHISFAPAITDTPERWTFRTIDVLDHRIALAIEATDPTLVVRLRHVVQLSATMFETRELAGGP